MKWIAGRSMATISRGTVVVRHIGIQDAALCGAKLKTVFIVPDQYPQTVKCERCDRMANPKEGTTMRRI